MNIVDISIKRPVTVLMASLAAITFGLMAYFQLPMSLLPEVKKAEVMITTVYAGASPDVVETQVTKHIEDAASSVSGVDTILSYSMDSASIVIVMFQDGVDAEDAVQDVKDKINAIMSDLPSGIDTPSIEKEDISNASAIINIILEGDMDTADLYDMASITVKDALSQVQGVAGIDISGGAKREIHINFEKSTVFERFISPAQAAQIIAQATVELPGGNLTLDNQDVPVRFKGEFTSIDEIEDIDLSTQAGTFKLRQLATVEDTVEKVRARTIILDKARNIRNENAILLGVMKSPDANTVQVVEGIMQQLPQIEKDAGGRIHLDVISEDASFIRASVNDTVSNLIMGIILTGLVLLVFLHDWRSTIIISISMPFSIIATFLVMQWMNIGLNLLSLMGLSCAVGTLVANSVVVLENIFRLKEEGLNTAEAASKGTTEVIVAVFASTLTNVAVFLPMGSIQGMVGQILSPFAYAVVISTSFSIIVSFTVTPLLAARMLPDKKKELKISAALEGFFKKLADLYGASLSGMLKSKKRCLVIVAAAAALFAFSLFVFTKLPMQNFPASDGGKLQINVELAQGSTLDMTAALLKQVEDKVSSHAEVVTVLTTLGSMGDLDSDVSMAQVSVTLVDKSKRKMSNLEFASTLERDLSTLPGAEIRVSATSEMSMMNRSSPIDLYIMGPDLTVLQQLGEEMRDRATKIPGIMNASISAKTGKPELEFTPDRKQIAADGLTVEAIAISLRAAVDGLKAAVYRDGGNEYDIKVMMKDSALKDVEDVRGIPIQSKNGVFPLSRYAKTDFDTDYSEIRRANKERMVELTGDTLPGYADGTLNTVLLESIGEMNLPDGYSIEPSIANNIMNQGKSGLGIVFIIAIVLVYMLLAAILENLAQPIYIISTVPLAIIGVSLGCFITGTMLNILALITIVMLVGVVVNNAILILDYSNQRQREGLSVSASLIDAGEKKLKAILMSNIAIILGNIPMALGIGASMAEMRQPMGVILIGGIISSTIMTLWFIPCLEFLFKRRSKELEVSRRKPE